MSQRCLVTLKKNITPEDSRYDCVYTEDNTYENLLFDWCGYDAETGISFGPLKVVIRDMEIYDAFCEDFKKLSKYLPLVQSFDDIWAIYFEDKILHLSQKEDKIYMDIINIINKLNLE